MGWARWNATRAPARRLARRYRNPGREKSNRPEEFGPQNGGRGLPGCAKKDGCLRINQKVNLTINPGENNLKKIQCICIPCVVVETQSTERRPSRRRARILDPRRTIEKFIAVSGVSRVTASGRTPRAVHALWHFGSWRAGAPSPENSKWRENWKCWF